ncbi:hypothetical protein [Natronomonas marina]|uniref:hypothetical protein n=1 Tax=Natronomonas marina TaxID=2961939 RepID=UPI0020CA072D|nr:hypothetical protein [Natronomonas marina]
MIGTITLQSGIERTLMELAPFLALGIGLYWLWTLFVRTFRSDEDPSYRKFSSSRVGSASFLVSGAYFSGLVAAAIAAMTWPLVLESPLIAVALVGGVAYHAMLEYQESAT